jgi:hypothetical protein
MVLIHVLFTETFRIRIALYRTQIDQENEHGQDAIKGTIEGSF